MNTNQIVNEIEKLTKISLQQSDCLGRGANAEVYSYMINNHPIAVKIFK